VRVRILKSLNGVIEGRSLSRLLPGYVYDVDSFTGQQLIELKAAIEVRSTDPALATVTDEDLQRVSGGVIVVPSDRADDRPERRRKRR
jgi:hypothetical protein